MPITSYFSFVGNFYEQVIANLYMKDFKKRVLDQVSHKLFCWFSYEDDTFIIWPHDPDRLKDFINHQHIQFTMVMETDDPLPFLDIDTYRKSMVP